METKEAIGFIVMFTFMGASTIWGLWLMTKHGLIRSRYLQKKIKPWIPVLAAYLFFLAFPLIFLILLAVILSAIGIYGVYRLFEGWKIKIEG